MEPLDTIFLQARELADPAQRAAYLTQACGGDADVRQRVEAMLQDALEAEEFFGPVEASRPAAAPSPPLEGPGTWIGRYKLLERIGEGGMGVVYMAEQREPVARKVALKIIKAGMDTRQVVARFEAERQALALMDHPNIAKVFDGGSTEMGRPYFVMDLVSGLPITKFCDEAKLSTRERLELFLDVCSAIQHAHQKGIIHRDIKPSNILVTLHGEKPVPKVIDFGIAKATQGRLTDKTLFTQFQHFIGTPAYMSPEQASLSGLDMDTRSDIYGLGVLLYELLTGATPFNAKELLQSGLDEMRRTIQEQEPARPSTRLRALSKENLTTTAGRRRTDAPRLISALRGDLDSIVIKCLEKDRARRYDTANGLAADIQRHLQSEPVVARPPSAGYRFQKLVRRNRAASAAVSLVSLAVAIGVVVSTWALLREREVRRQSDERLRAALAFVDDVMEVVPEFSKLTGAANAQARFGQAGVKFMQRLGSAGTDPAWRLTLARLFVKTSDAQNPDNANSIGDFEAGLQQARQAIELLATDSLPVTASERLELLCDAKFNRDMCLYGLGQVDEAIGHLDELDLLYEELGHLPEWDRYARRMRQGIRNNAGYYTTLAGRPKEAIERFLLPILKSDWAQSINTNVTNSEGYELETLVNANAYVASAHLFLKQFRAMLPYTEESVRVADLLVQRFPSTGLYSRQRVRSLTLMGYALTRTGEIDRGMELLKQSREEIEALVGKDKFNHQFHYQRAVTAAIQALAFSAWSEEDSASKSERSRRLDQAASFLAEAEQFSLAAKTREPESYLKESRAEVAAAKAKLESLNAAL